LILAMTACPSSVPNHTCTQTSANPAPLNPLQRFQQLLRCSLRIVVLAHVGQGYSHADSLAVLRSPVVLHVTASQEDDNDHARRSREKCSGRQGLREESEGERYNRREQDLVRNVSNCVCL
jgi:hypothetical protein